MGSRRDDLDLRIRALVQGVQEVEELANEVQTLQRRAGRDIPDNTARFRRGMEQTQRQAERATKALRGMRGAVAGVGAAAGAIGVTAAVRNMQRVAGELDTLAQQAEFLDVPVERIQELSFAFQALSDEVDSEDVIDAMQSLTDAAVDAAEGSDSAQESFERLGLSVEEIRRASPEQLFMMVADQMAAMDDASQQVAAASTLFGDELARRVVPILQEGSEGLQEYAERARDLDAVHGREQVQNIREYSRQMREIRQTVDAAWARAVAENADEFESLGQNLQWIVEDVVPGAISTFNSLVESTRGMAEAVSESVENLRGRFLQAEIEGLRSEIDRLRESEGDHSDELDRLEDRLRSAREEYRALGEEAEETADKRRDAEGEEIGARADLPDVTATPEDELDPGDLRLREQFWNRRLRSEQEHYREIQDPIERVNRLLEAQQEAEAALASTHDRGQQVRNATATATRALAEAERERSEEARRAREGDAEHIEQLEQRIELEQMTAREAAKMRAEMRLSEHATEEQVERARELAAELHELRGQYDRFGMDMDEFAREASRRVQQTFGDLLYKPWEQSTEEMGRQLVNSLHRAAAEALASQAMQQLMQMVGAMGGNGQAGAGQQQGGGWGQFLLGALMYLAPLAFHSGGVVGSGDGTPRGPVPASTFANAPRLHGGGLAGDEVPAILQKGEQVIPRDQVQAGGGGNVRVVNVQDPSIAEDYIRSAPGERSILNVIRRNRRAVKEQLR